MNAKEVYECLGCGKTHDDQDDAAECCRPSVRMVYRCDICQKTHGSGYRAERRAETCCADRVARGEVKPAERCLCGNGATSEDVQDSKLIGSLIRCRACLVVQGIPSVDMIIGVQ